MIKKNLTIMPCKFSNDLFALKKYAILHTENQISNKSNNKIEHQAFYGHCADKLIVAYIFET